MRPQLFSILESRIEELRRKHGSGVYASVIGELIVPWRPLSLQQYLKYMHWSSDGIHLDVVLEDEIFLTCVLDDSLCRRMGKLKAGTISLVVQHIWQASIPSTIHEINGAINTERQKLENNKVIGEFVKLITLAFPYKPEEVYAMGFREMARVLVLAEQKLMFMGLLTQPIQVLDPEAQPKPKPPRIDPRKVWEEEHDLVQNELPVPDVLQHPFAPGEQEILLARARGREAPQPVSSKRQTWKEQIAQLKKPQKVEVDSVLLPYNQLPPEIKNDPKTSPIILYGGEQDRKKIDFAMDEVATLASLTGGERLELEENRIRMVQEAQKLYATELEYLEKRRVEIARQRAQTKQGSKK